MFADFARIHIKSGKGGDGHVSFRREKFVPAGGPDGGDGGRGGDVILEVDPAMNTLFIYKHRYQFRAGDGEEGGKKRCHGKDGASITLKVPEGTILREEHSGKVIADMSGDNRRQVILRGGRGGRGNMNFATPTNQAPQYGEPGRPALELDCTMELKLVADVGLIGFPNAGKSTFLSRVTRADPKIANYPFTTINPNLGVVDLGDGRGFVIADMPGLIEGASEGVGLGFQFLRHIERTRVLIHLVDTASFDGRDPVEDVRTINRELEKYNPEILKKPMVIAANKIDVSGNLPDDPVRRLREAFEPEGLRVYPISAVTGEGVRPLLEDVRKLLDTTAKDRLYYEQEFFPEDMIASSDLPYTITTEEDHAGTVRYVVEGPKIDRMLSYTNLDSEKGFRYFQQFLKRAGISDALRKAGVREGDTVRMYGHEFTFYEEEEETDESDK
ncbi:GTPase ObgE [Chordicoccus furentiruminis]|uniref:GTPase ObgE n=1 Tax=Chordicoccus furentiruminis TaxID=2709410 RepID=UPI0023A908CE|nr:GTPase ObgE [Chordicoccus furentiruminis]